MLKLKINLSKKLIKSKIKNKSIQLLKKTVIYMLQLNQKKYQNNLDELRQK